MEGKMSVKEFYKGRSIFVTGGTGFMGKVLVEKILYTIPDIRAVYLLLRPKRGKSIRQRMDDMLLSPMFNRIKDKNKEILEKIKLVDGDVLSEDLGISNDDMATLSKEVSVVFHMAATVNMRTSLKVSVAMNVAGTQRVLNVARKFKSLEMLVHVSTTFCYPECEILEEKFHIPPVDPRDIMRICDWMDEKQLQLLTPSLLGHHPNTYTYTKRLAESLVNDVYPHLPCVIARPSIVCPAFLDPMPGWVDNLTGPAGLLAGAGKGVIRTMLCDSSLNAQFIAVDVAINALIALAMIESSKKIRSENIPIYNLNLGAQYPMTWGELLLVAKAYQAKYPLAWPLWIPNGSFTTNYTLHETRRILFHLVPAYIIDFLLWITGQKRFMVRLQEKISYALELLQYFTLREWNFPCPNFNAIHSLLSKEEAEVYVTYKENVNREEYIITAMEGGRVYALKEDPKKIPLNRIYFNFLYALDMTVKIVFWCYIISWFAVWFEPVRYVLSFAEPVVKYLPFLGSALGGRL